VSALSLIVAVPVIAYWFWHLRKNRGLTQPLGSIARLYGTALAAYIVITGYALAHHLFLGGAHVSVCVNTGYPFSGAGAGYAAKGGASISAVGSVRACALHPSPTQLALFMLTKLPAIAVWCGVLLLVWRLLSQAERDGPFTARAATIMQRLGWVVIGGAMIAGALGALGTDLLTRTLVTPVTYSVGGTIVGVLGSGALKALLPLPAIVGATLLSFARIIRAGAAMDEEIKATV
jgi:hypothetical protein